MIWRARVGVGAPGTPTPAGRFYVREKIRNLRGDPLYGPWAIGTSAYSRLSEWPGGGVIGIHGTDQPGLDPGRPSHGCMRFGTQRARLVQKLPLGTPIWIHDGDVTVSSTSTRGAERSAWRRAVVVAVAGAAGARLRRRAGRRDHDATRDVRRAQLSGLHGHRGEPRAQQHQESLQDLGADSYVRRRRRGEPAVEQPQQPNCTPCRTGASRSARLQVRRRPALGLAVGRHGPLRASIVTKASTRCSTATAATPARRSPAP